MGVKKLFRIVALALSTAISLVPAHAQDQDQTSPPQTIRESLTLAQKIYHQHAPLYIARLKKEIEKIGLNGFSCEKGPNESFAEDYKTSDTRRMLADPLERGNRGKVYAQFMDTFYESIDARTTSPKTVGNVLALIRRAYNTAYSKQKKPLRNIGVTPYLVVDAYTKGIETRLPPEKIAATPLANIPDIRNAFTNTRPDTLKRIAEENIYFDHGTDVKIEFVSPKFGMVTSRIGTELLRYTIGDLDSPVINLRGKRDVQYLGYENDDPAAREKHGQPDIRRLACTPSSLTYTISQ